MYSLALLNYLVNDQYSGGSKIFKGGFLKVGIMHLNISRENFEILEALRVHFRLLLVSNYNKCNALNYS